MSFVSPKSSSTSISLPLPPLLPPSSSSPSPLIPTTPSSAATSFADSGGADGAASRKNLRLDDNFVSASSPLPPLPVSTLSPCSSTPPSFTPNTTSTSPTSNSNSPSSHCPSKPTTQFHNPYSFADIEFAESQSSFSLFSVSSLPHVYLIPPHVTNLQDFVPMDQSHFSRLAESMSEFVESQTSSSSSSPPSSSPHPTLSER